MAKTDLQTAQIKWQQRASQARSLGFSDSVWKPLMEQDFRQIMQRGSAPMADAEVIDAIRAATGTSPIKDPGKGTSPLDILGNIPSDLQSLVTGFIPGAVGYVTSLPRQLEDLAQLGDPSVLDKYGMEPLSDPASVLRDIARLPVIAPLVPGLHTAAELTTSAGRKRLEQSPVSTAVDVGAAASIAGGLGLFGSGAAEAEATQTGLAKALEAVTPGRPEGANVTLPKPTALAALQEGKAFKAVGRTGLDIAEKLPGGHLTRPKIRDTLMRIGWHPELTKLGKAYYQTRSILHQTMDKFATELVDPITKWMAPAERELFNRVEGGQSFMLPEETQSLVDAGLIDAVPALTIRESASGYKTYLRPDGTLASRAEVDAFLNPKLHDNIRNPADPLTPNPGLDASLQVAAQKAIDNNRFHNDVPPTNRKGQQARPTMQELSNKNRRYIEQAALHDKNLRVVESSWNRKYVYHKTHPVGRAWITSQRLFQAMKGVEDKLAEAYRKRSTIADDPNLGPGSLEHSAAEASVNHFTDQYQRAAERYARAKTEFNRRLEGYAPTAFTPILDPIMRERAKASLQGVSDSELRHRAGVTVHSVQAALTQIEGSVDWNMMAQSIGTKEADLIHQEVESTWSTLARAGMDPLYLPNLDPSREEHVMYPTVIATSPSAEAHASKNTMFNLSRSRYDVALGLAEHQRQLLTEMGTRTFTNTVRQYALNPTEQITRIEDAIRNGGGESSVGIILRDTAKREMKANFDDWNPDDYGWKAYFPGDTKYVMHKGVQRSIRYLQNADQISTPLKSFYDRSMNVWRFSVLTTPRHLSHVLLGGAMMGILQDPFFIPHFIKYHDQVMGLIHGDNMELIAKLAPNVNDLNDHQAFALRAAMTGGRMFGEVANGAAHGAMNLVQKVNKFEESVTLMYKITTMLAQEGKVGREEAINLANKWFVDMNAMTPFERTYIRKILPFYGFTRHLFRYVMSYPADHPLAASILTNFANQHYDDWNSGLPRNLSFLFYLGQPDVNGNVTGIDYRSIDPFRSSYNIFSLAGFTSGLAPEIQLIAQQAGVNTLSATPELYPQMHYDPASGQLVADQPAGGPLRVLETYFPQTTAIDAFLGLSDQFRNLAISDPAAFHHRVFTALGIPFAPEQFNLPLRVQDAQMKRYRDAQTAINKAIQTGNFESAKRYASVPVPSSLAQYMGNIKYASPQQIENVYNGLRQRLAQGDTSLHAVLPKPTRRRTSG